VGERPELQCRAVADNPICLFFVKENPIRIGKKMAGRKKERKAHDGWDQRWQYLCNF
jgi:hypothetical protein